ncbi:MAG TPA: DUF72 domain-containing protein [Candidatus Atribacteria bacterium]|nr:DUF72 domain-containing protein [Candidatus Atribacteria bacterium]
MQRNLFIGTSGYSYKHWSDGVFYPPEISSTKWLEYYCQFFNTVELNMTFYRLPKKETFKRWYERTPDNFTFAVKGSRFITHIKKLNNCEEPLELFLSYVQELKGKLGVVLWQLPPNLHFDEERISYFCQLLKSFCLSQNISQTFEFRHKSWFCPELFNILKDYNFSLCIAHSKRWPYIEKIIANFVYLRFHGGEELYGSSYSDRELKYWADKSRHWSKEGKIIYAYFNNDAYGYAVKNALKFKELLENI